VNQDTINITVEIVVQMDLYDVPVEGGQPLEDALDQMIRANLSGGGIDIRSWNINDWSIAP
jgi:hypothetical protein